ncbi:MAG: triose-phosphate isomerase [Chloroflexi bacterium]|nr:triose-phosphate isomerase [Chloroflexota bacterium]
MSAGNFRTPLIAGNWKMHTTLPEALALAAALGPGLERVTKVESVVCPPFVSLAAVADALRGSPVGVGAQDCYSEDKGAYTGEVSPAMLAGLCQYVILGHSERRQYQGETDDLINRKVVAALRHSLRPILCVGERLEENEAGHTSEVVERQIRRGLQGIADPAGLVVAYEPVWAIGTGRSATGAQAGEVAGLIRRLLGELWGANAAAATRILYGGSVTAANIDEFAALPDIDGGLVGGASLRADEFVAIVERTASHAG